MIKVIFASIMLWMSCAIAIAQEENDDAMELIVVHPNPEDDWLFGFHDAISDSVYGTAQWFDSFFAVDEIDETKAESSLRIRFGWEPRARDFDVFTQKFRLHLKLPNLENKIDLIFSDELDDNKGNEAEQDIGLTNEGGDSFTAAVRLINVDTLSQFVDSRIGISSGDIFAKTRLKLLTDFSEKHQFKFEPSIYYYLDDGFGQRLLVEYNYNYSSDKQFRMNYSIKFSQAFDGNRWKQSNYFLQQIDRRRASAIGVVIHGEDNADRGFSVDNYRLSYLYRANAYRKWLYFEIEPFLEWPEKHDYTATPGIALRLEGYFTRK